MADCRVIGRENTDWVEVQIAMFLSKQARTVAGVASQASPNPS